MRLAYELPPIDDGTVEVGLSRDGSLFMLLGAMILLYLLIGGFWVGCTLRDKEVPLAKTPRMADFLVTLGVLVFWPALMITTFYRRMKNRRK